MAVLSSYGCSARAATLCVRKHALPLTRHKRVSKRVSVSNTASPVVSRAELVDASVSLNVQFVSTNDGFYTIKGTMRSVAPGSLAFATLTDYERNNQIFRGVSESRLLQTSPSKQLLQVCEWRFLAFKGTFDTVLTVEEVPESRALTFKLVKSSFLKDFEGEWKVHEEEGGGCLVEHTLSVKPAVAPPRIISFYTSSIFERQVQQLLMDLELELQRRMQPSSEPTCDESTSDLVAASPLQSDD